MDDHGQGEVDGISPAYASPQSNISDTKVCQAEIFVRYGHILTS
jgi:hypothetical protein